MSQDNSGVDTDSAVNAFAALGDDTRLNIFQALGATRMDPEGVSLSFSELRKAASIRDKGRFNYHLDKLVGPFIWKVDGQYFINYTGLQLYHLLRAGQFSEPEHESWELDATCQACGGPIEAIYRDALQLYCPDCEIMLTLAPLSPSAMENQSREEALRSADSRLRSQLSSFRRGVCPWCSGRIEYEFRADMDNLRHDNDELILYVVNRCLECDGTRYAHLGQLLITHPAIITFAENHDIDLEAQRLWEMEFVMSDSDAIIDSREPWKVQKTFTRNGNSVTLSVTEALEISRD